MNIFLTGSTGFIGSTLLALLTQQGHTVHVLCRTPQSIGLDGRAGIRPFRGDICSLQDVERAMEGCEVAFHLAGYARNWSRDPSVYSLVNVGGTETVLKSARQLGLRRVVYTSSAMVLGPSNGTPVTETTIRKLPVLTEYERSKIAAEQVVVSSAQNGLETVIVNPTRVFGPGLLNEGNSVTKMIKMYVGGTWRVLPGSGHALGNYAFVRDVATGHLLAMQRGRPGERYVLGGENVSYRGFFEAVAQAAGVHRRMFSTPPSFTLTVARAEELRAKLFRGYPGITPGWAATFLADCACSSGRAERELGYSITPLKRALAETVRWLSNGVTRNTGIRSEEKS